MKLRVVAALAVACVLGAPASAQDHGGRGYGGWQHHYRSPSNDPLSQLGGNIIGGMVGGMIGSWFSRPEPTPPPVVVYVPQPPLPVELVPFSPEWMDYCAEKYKSFEPRSGRYTGYDGIQHFCQ